ADDPEHGDAGSLVILDLGRHLAREPAVDARGVPQHDRQKRSSQPVAQPAPSAEEEEEPALQHASPRVLLGTGKLDDADLVSQARLHDLPDRTAAHRSAEVARVLVEEAVGEKDDPPPARVPDPLLPGRGVARPRSALGGRPSHRTTLRATSGTRLNVRMPIL